ncbi:hypothetical protein K7432_009607 [Basidiobolus ranarum]|uniref:Uncharacterized protein n=1 Tax=Basidiobolus ranarum TaxID=34480 RepID=A0ABR2WQ11_9FUNG
MTVVTSTASQSHVTSPSIVNYRSSEDTNSLSDFQNVTVFAQIFQLQKWKVPNQSLCSGARRNHPLSLFCEAEQQLAVSVKLLENVREVNSDEFRRFIDRVHQHQTELLNTIYLVYSEMDSVLKCSRGYRRYLSQEDREELDHGFSETILFAAQALSKGFQIRGIEYCSEELRGPAQKLCATFEALRYVFQYKATEYPDSISLVGLFPVVMDFDQAWVDFEKAICYIYFNINGRRARERENEEINERRLWVGLMWDTLEEIVEKQIVSSDAIKEYDPSIFFALPRMTLLSLLKVPFDSIKNLKALSSYTDEMKQICEELANLTPTELLTLQKWLCGEEVNPAIVNIHQTFTKLCAIVDPLQSGPSAKFFLSVMSKVFQRHIDRTSEESH